MVDRGYQPYGGPTPPHLMHHNVLLLSNLVWAVTVERPTWTNGSDVSFGSDFTNGMQHVFVVLSPVSVSFIESRASPDIQVYAQ